MPVLMPEIARLSLEGNSHRAIGLKLGIPRQTIDRWMRKQRRICAVSAARKAEDLFPAVVARLEAVYGEAMEGCRR
jgi:IS30 family transposase